MEKEKKIVLSLYNTLERKKTEFVPLDPGRKSVKIYTCGPTVYNYAHIGNLRTYVFEDILKRTLRFNGFEVYHVMNITDVGHLTDDADDGEDKIEKGASREGTSVWEIAKKYTLAFQEDIRELNILFPDVWCKATDHIEEQIALVKRLEGKGITYRLDDGIYFNTELFPSYKDFARLDVEKIKAGARVEMVEGKKNATDFALWKFSPKTGARRQMEWDSPWGTGFPGWHIECSAMSMHYLGDQFDIHCGGIDHIPIHHTNEIAQVEAVTGKRWVSYWLHGEFLVVQAPKEEEARRMGKSEGNFLTLQVLKDRGFLPLAYRYFILNAHYRKQLVFSEEAMRSAQNGFLNFQARTIELKESAETYRGKPGKKDVEKAKKYEIDFLSAIDDDLNTPEALALAWEMLHDKEFSPVVKWETLKKLDDVLGLNVEAMREPDFEIPADVQGLIEERQQARKEKDWKKSDEIRDRLKIGRAHV